MYPENQPSVICCRKSMNSAKDGKRIEKRQLDTSKQLTSYIPELEETGLAGATVQQVLDMQVGVKFSEDYDDLDGDWRLCELATGWREPAPDYQGPREMIGYMQTLKDSDRQHGTEFHYQSILTDVLGICIERAAGASFLDLFEKHIWSRIGTEQEFVTIIDAAGNPVFEGGFNTCLRDFARFGQLICQGGVWEGEQLVPGRWIDECRFPTDRLVKVFSESEYGPALHKAAYHNKWWIRDTQRGVMMALGIHGQTLYIDPDKQFMVAKYSSQPEQTDIDLALSQVLGFETIANSL